MKLQLKDIIIFENENYIVVNKPAFISSLDERNKESGSSILQMARDYAGDVQLAHRLDKETSGALAIAKNPEAYRHLSMQFENRQVSKKVPRRGRGCTSVRRCFGLFANFAFKRWYC